MMSLEFVKSAVRELFRAVLMWTSITGRRLRCLSHVDQSSYPECVVPS